MNPATPEGYIGPQSTTLTINTQGAPMPAAKPNPADLRNILDTYAVPDPSLVATLPKGGVQLPYVGHAEVTRILIEIDPLWSWEPVAWDNGRPAITVTNGMASMWGRLTILGKTVLGVGIVQEKKPDLDKELISDFIKNAAMRLGIALSLWAKAEWHDMKEAEAQGNTIVDDPFEWARTSMLEATSIPALDIVATLAKKKLTQAERDELRPVYLKRKAEIEAQS